MAEIKPIQILVVEDEAEQRDLICGLLKASNFQVISADCVEQAIVLLKQHPVDLVFSDWKLGNLSGIDLLNFIRSEQQPQIDKDMAVIIATAHGTISHAVEAMQRGADDYLAKPFQRQELLLTLDKALKARDLRQQNQLLSEQLSERSQLVDLVGQAPCMQTVYNRIAQVSATDATILILGESGTGKELAARALHHNSQRVNQNFVAINCGAIPESLAEAELFGAMKGAYTGANQDKIGKLEAANHGTLFLDEIAELSAPLQVKVLRFLQEGTIQRLGSHEEKSLDVRVIAATHKNLEAMVARGEFREDLFYRLNIIPIEMPALRQRQQDIPFLCEHFLKLHSKRHQRQPMALSEQALRTLLDYHWPGNVRELSNRIERLVLLNDEQELLLNTQSPISDNNNELPAVEWPEQGFSWETFERHALAQSLQRHQGNRTKAAKYLQLPYKAFLYRLEKYDLNK
ncbi:sigma-54-dependent transcriptional regulator [Thalassotalea mangrovi]|uniref:Sigma-54-dependent Fis family transcriptional regulator n=1 Tax=Thalassotalea mangrovi TaxID=2572245 RepID=A0A4U1B5Y7_9GAMM|nr:sigma-54 dependent transcriptional regulator [Thalassotalea mangrovi]TKB45816.1 sigma-54-dependent Fis family transcriptional regulator [Thalassotalea mangrovi]